MHVPCLQLILVFTQIASAVIQTCFFLVLDTESLAFQPSIARTLLGRAHSENLNA